MSEVENKVEETVTNDQPEIKQDEVNDQAARPLTEEELRKNQEEEDRKTMRVIQVVQHQKGGRIEIYPVQNIGFRSDIIGILTQALNNIQNEDVMRNNAALLRESINILKTDLTPKS